MVTNVVFADQLGKWNRPIVVKVPPDQLLAMIRFWLVAVDSVNRILPADKSDGRNVRSPPVEMTIAPKLKFPAIVQVALIVNACPVVSVVVMNVVPMLPVILIPFETVIVRAVPLIANRPFVPHEIDASARSASKVSV